MNSSDIPSRITKAFGVNGLKNTILWIPAHNR
jgi:hypothetical protein